MKKEIIICIVVVSLVIILNVITEKHTNKTMEEITEDLTSIRKELISKDERNLENDINNVLNKWLEKSDALAYYIEHDELEKVELYIREVNANIETKEYNMAIQALDSCNFIIAHIKEKYKFSFQNIF